MKPSNDLKRLQRSTIQPARGIAVTAIAAAVSALLLAACADTAAQGQAAATSPPQVNVVEVKEQALDHSLSQIGRVEAARRVEIRPRVSGHVEAVLFKEGDVVKAGQPLFKLDSRYFEAEVNRRQGELEMALAREVLTRDELARAKELATLNALSGEELARRQAAASEAGGRVTAARAALQSAQLDREFATVRAPISGRIGRAQVTEGNFVNQGATQPPLASLVATRPLHVYFDIADAALIAKLQAQKSAADLVANIFDGTGTTQLASGRIDFSDNEITAGTGTLRLRARIDDPRDALLPGQFVKARIVTRKQMPTLTIPAQAVSAEQGKHVVMIVGSDGKVTQRAVTLGALIDGQRIVQAGLKAGDRVVTSGLMRIRPGMTVEARSEKAGTRMAAQGGGQS